MNKGYKYRFYPTEEQKQQIKINLDCQRYVWNGFLALKETRYKNFGENVSWSKMDKMLTQIKQCDSWLKDADKWVLQQALRQLDAAFKRFFRHISRYPKFKSKKNKKDSYTTKPYFRKDGSFSIAKLGELNIKYHRPLEVDNIGMCTISKHNDKYYISFNVDVTINKFDKTNKSVGIDLGLKTFAYTSDNEQYILPKKIWCLESRLQKQQRKLSKKPDKNSKHYLQLKQYIANLHEKITNIRKDFQHKLSTDLVKRYDIILIEDLNIQGMMKNHHLSRAIGRCGFYEFKSMLEYKCQEHDKQLIVIDRWYPSSKICSCCGNKKEDLKLQDRTYICEKCGTIIDRDYNASINIKNYLTNNQ